MSDCKKNPADVPADKLFDDKLKDEKLKYPVEEVMPNEPVDEENIKDAVDELNPDDDTMDDVRG